MSVWTLKLSGVGAVDGVVSADVKGKISKIRDGCRLIFDNASSLYDEAQVLGGAGYFQRCAFLHLISIEECAKIDSLAAAAKGLLVGFDVDLVKLHKELTKHKVKNHINAWNFPFTAEEEAAHSAGNREEARVAANKLRNEYHSFVNGVKNNSLYVDFNGSDYRRPLESVDESDAVWSRDINAEFLRRSELFLRLLDRMVEVPDGYKKFWGVWGDRIVGSKDREELRELLSAMLEDYIILTGQVSP